MLAGLSSLVIEEVTDEGEWIRVQARTPGAAVYCPDCGVTAVRVHSYHERMVHDVPVDARRIQIVVRVRRLIGPGTPHEWEAERGGPRRSYVSEDRRVHRCLDADE